MIEQKKWNFTSLCFGKGCCCSNNVGYGRHLAIINIIIPNKGSLQIDLNFLIFGEDFEDRNMSQRGRRSVLSCSQQSANAEMSQTEQAEDCIECKVKLRDSERALQCNFYDNTFCYKCTWVSCHLLR